jgi:hypothetical protein
MNPITASVWIDAVPEEVFAIATNFGGCADWLSGVKETRVLTPGPVGVGTKFTETRLMGGSEATEEMTVSAFDPPRSYTLQCDSHGLSFSSVLMFEADRDGTIVSMDMQIRPVSFGAKLMSPLMGMMAGKLRKHLAQDLHDLKAAAEKTHAAAAGG